MGPSGQSGPTRPVGRPPRVCAGSDVGSPCFWGLADEFEPGMARSCLAMARKDGKRGAVLDRKFLADGKFLLLQALVRLFF